MAGRLNLTRPELKRQRELLSRFSRYLPMLKLKQQLLQVAMQKVSLELQKIEDKLKVLNSAFEKYSAIIVEGSGVNLAKFATPLKINHGLENVAGAEVPYYTNAEFCALDYDFFETPAWVDVAISDLRKFAEYYAAEKILKERNAILAKELAKTLQRVNLFEKVKIPDAKEAIRKIRIKLGDEMAASVARAKAAKAKQQEVA